MKYYFYLISLHLLINLIYSNNIEESFKTNSSVLCHFLTVHNVIDKSKTIKCSLPTCKWNSWNQDHRTVEFNNILLTHMNNTNSSLKNSMNTTTTILSHDILTPKRIILSYGHNGFGNQLWQHTIAFLLAEELNATLYISILPYHLRYDGIYPPNTIKGIHAIERLLPSKYFYYPLQYMHNYMLNTTIPSKIAYTGHTEIVLNNKSNAIKALSDQYIRNKTSRRSYDEYTYYHAQFSSPDDVTLCENEPFYISDRPKDWRNHAYKKSFQSQLQDILIDKKPRCIKMVGYFQNYPLCTDDVQQLWTPTLFKNYIHKPSKNDLSIYLRCLPHHYHFNSPYYYEMILNHTTYDQIWLFLAPECPNVYSPKLSPRNSIVVQVLQLLETKYNATRWKGLSDGDSYHKLFYDFSALAQSNKLIIPQSSWAEWAGIFSNATEIHVNSPPLHGLMGANRTQYIYHDEKRHLYHGRISNVTNKIIYQYT